MNTNLLVGCLEVVYMEKLLKIMATLSLNWAGLRLTNIKRSFFMFMSY